MIKLLSSALCILCFFGSIHAQKYFTRSGELTFHSRAVLEDIDAFNNQGPCVLDVGTGQIQMAVLIKGFQFEKALMQEHFNENYMESDRYPKAVFKGKILNMGGQALKFGQEMQEYPIEGEITIRDVTRPLSISAQLQISNGKIAGQSSFSLEVADFGIQIPAVVRDNIAKIVEVRVKLQMDPM